MKFLLSTIFLISGYVQAQQQWQNMDDRFEPLPKSIHVFYSSDSLDGKPFLAYYVSADLKDKTIDFTAQTSSGKRYTPSQYFEQEANPLLVVNCTFFEFVHNNNLNVVVKNGRLEAYNIRSIEGRGKDTFTYQHPFGSALGISKNRKADVAWLYTDSAKPFPYASQMPVKAFRDSNSNSNWNYIKHYASFKKWQMQTAVGGGPVLLQNGEIKITNNEELKFTGKAIADKHPRTAMGYTKDGKLIILVIQGRFPGKAEGATLEQEAKILKQIGCVEALNLDGGGSSCMLINGKQTITPSDKEGERPVPAVFIIKKNNKF